MHFYVVYVIINVYTRHTSDNSIINRQGVGMEKEVGFLHLNCCNGAVGLISYTSIMRTLSDTGTWKTVWKFL